MLIFVQVEVVDSEPSRRTLRRERLRVDREVVDPRVENMPEPLPVPGGNTIERRHGAPR